MLEVEAEPIEENDNREMETISEQIPLVEDEEIHFRMSPPSPSYPDITENFLKQAKSSRRGEGNNAIMEMLRTMNKDMEEREQKWEKQ